MALILAAVKAHEAGSHSKEGWEVFTQKLVDLVDMYGGSGEVGKRGKGVVFMAWGAHAAKRVAKLDGTKHLILKSAVGASSTPMAILTRS